MATVQETLEAALSQIADASLRVVCAGRTDTGVHASCQVVHFDSPVSRPPRAWTLGANALMPDDIAIVWASSVPERFHARFSAESRRYRYLILNRPTRPGLESDRCSWSAANLDCERMHEAAQCLLGEQDFSAFRAAGCQSRSPMRRIESVSVARHDDLVVIDIAANAFLHHMVRNIAGALLCVGCGKKPSQWLVELLASGDRQRGAATACAAGLYLVDVRYPQEFGLPRPKHGPWTLPL